ncbi:MAG: hypothetical protein IT371_30935 [Deltaproteobacteria bacterium]|nr:hypothetical protein [Deltaproteobacteria bacterium]
MRARNGAATRLVSFVLVIVCLVFAATAASARGQGDDGDTKGFFHFLGLTGHKRTERQLRVMGYDSEKSFRWYRDHAKGSRDGRSALSGFTAIVGGIFKAVSGKK